jgi:hypothetical protein
MRALFLFFLLICSAACQNPAQRGEEDKHFYSYVDARGNLVTVDSDGRSGGPKESELEPAEGKGETVAGVQQKGGSLGEAVPGQGIQAFMDVNPEKFQTPEEAKEKLEARVRESEQNRFVSYRGPEGEIVTRPLDLVAERRAAKQREQSPGFEELERDPRFRERKTRVPADCCRHLVEDAAVLREGTNTRLRLDGSLLIRLDRDRPATVVRLGPGIGVIEVKSYLRKQSFLAPQLLVLNKEGFPILKVDSLFTRHYPENWARHGFMQGRMERAPSFAYLVFYLPYAVIGEEGMRQEPVRREGDDPFQHSLQGELVVEALPHRPSRAGRQ